MQILLIMLIVVLLAFLVLLLALAKQSPREKQTEDKKQEEYIRDYAETVRQTGGSMKKLEHWKVIAIYLIIYDIIAVNFSYFMALLVRFDFRYSSIPTDYFAAWRSFAPIYTIIILAVFGCMHLYNSVWRFASFHAILYVYGRYMKERGKLLTNTVVTTVMSNFGLYKAFDALDIDYAKTAVGDKYVYEYMMQNGCRIGGEQSGHIIFSKYASTGDGILTSLKMMEVIMARKKKLSELTADLAIYPQVLENVRVHDKAAAQADVDVQAAVESVAEALGDTGRILVRESGTEPLLRVMVEAESEELCRKYVDQVVEIVRKKGHVAE